MATDLKKAFDQVCELFNNGDYEKLAQYLDTDIITKKVDDPGSVVGIGNVTTYFKAHQTSRNPKIEKCEIEKLVVDSSQTYGQVNGIAEYRDKAKDTKTTAIRFSFTFTRGSANEDWYLINSFACAR
jgi:hypothetical protein